MRRCEQIWMKDNLNRWSSMDKAQLRNWWKPAWLKWAGERMAGNEERALWQPLCSSLGMWHFASVWTLGRTIIPGSLLVGTCCQIWPVSWWIQLSSLFLKRRLVMDQIASAVDWGFLAIRKTMRKNGIGHHMRRTEVRKERQRSYRGRIEGSKRFVLCQSRFWVEGE